MQSELPSPARALRAPTLLTVSVVGRGVVQADAAEIDRQLVLEAAHHHLEDAPQVLALADGARDALQQREPLHLLGELSARAPAVTLR